MITILLAVLAHGGRDVEAHVRAELLARGVRVDAGVVVRHVAVEGRHERAEALLLGARVVAHVVAHHHQRGHRDLHCPRGAAKLKLI